MKELRLLARDPALLLLQVFGPLLLLAGAGAVFSSRLDRLPIAMRQPDGRQDEVLRRLRASEHLTLIETDSPEDALVRGEAPGALLLDAAAFDRPGSRREQVEILVDGADPAAWAVRAELQAAISGAQSGVSAVTWYNPAHDDALFFVPGVLALVLFAGAAILTALGLTREQEEGTWPTLAASPIGDLALFCGKLLPYLAQVLVIAALLFAAAALLFALPLRGSPWLLALSTLLASVAGIAAGTAIGARCPTADRAWTLLQVTVLLPALVLSGFLYPLSSMPLAAQAASHLFPLRSWLSLLRGILLKGAEIADCAAPLAELSAVTLALVGLALWAVRPLREARR
jgi:ABC-2 type transport system permease protein